MINTKTIKACIVILCTLPMIALARYGIYDDEYYTSSSGGVFDVLLSVIVSIFCIFLYIDAWIKWDDRKSSGKPTRNDTSEIGWNVFAGLFVGAWCLIPCTFILKILGLTSVIINILIYLGLVCSWVMFKCIYVLIDEQDNESVNNIKNQLTNSQSKLHKTKEPNKPMKTKSITLPFILKKEPEYRVTLEIKSNQRANSFIILIKNITVGYLKSMAEDSSDFVFAHTSEPTFDDDQLTVEKIYIIGQFIHDYVWHTMAENTSISNNHRLNYSIKYTPVLMQLTNNLHQDTIIMGMQIYIESLIDYYADKVLDNGETDNTLSTDDKGQQKSDDSWLDGIIGLAFMAFVVYNGYNVLIKDDNNTKETVTNQTSELMAQPLPNTGGTDNPNFYGSNPLMIKTQAGKNYWVKISNSVNDVAMASYFIRGGDTLDIKVPTGSYTIKYASGDSWYGTAHLFGEETQYAKADEVFVFGNGSGHTIELIYQTHGNLHTKGINANQF